VRYLEETIGQSRETIARLEAQVARLPQLREQAGGLASELAAIETRLEALSGELSEATSRREALESTKLELDGLTQQVAQLTTRLQGIGEQLVAAAQALAQAEQAQADMEASRPGHDSYEGAQAVLVRLEEERQERDRWRAQQAAQQTTLALAQAQVQRLEADLQDIEQAEALMAELWPQVERQQQIEAQLEEARGRVRALEAAQTQLDSQRTGLDDLRARLARVEAGLGQAEQLRGQLIEIQMHLEETRQRQLEASSLRAALTAEKERLDEQTHALEAAETATCPVCEQPLTARHRTDLLARNRGRIAALQEQVSAASARLTAAGRDETDANRTLKRLETQLLNCPRPAELADLQAQTSQLEEATVTLQRRVDELADSPDRAARSEAQLAGLQDPRRRHTELASQAARRSNFEEKLEAERHAVAALEASLVEIEQALQPFADLEERLQAQRAAVRQHEADHRRYLASTRAAAELPARRQAAAALQAQEAELTHQLEQTRARRDQVAASFDAAGLAAAQQHEAALKADQAGLTGQQHALERQVGDLTREVQALEGVEQQLAAEQAGLTHYQRQRDSLQFCRDVIRQAGPHVVRRLVQLVSLQATRLFANIMADQTARLHWQENYGIALEKDGRRRDFEQLSGGEQTAAALAVRLALLRELSSIDVAFFDEPTSNLDATRRDNLVEQILAVRNTGFSQLFVISHDDTFERATHHIIRVTKEQDESKIEIG
jgi:exonuclease SbcC